MPQKLSPLVTEKGDLCTSHVGQILHLYLVLRWRHLLEASMSTKRYARQLSEKNQSVGETEATEWIATLWQYSQRWNSGQSCTMEDFTDSGSISYMSKEVLNRLTSGRYCSNALCRRYRRLLDWQLVKNVTISIICLIFVDGYRLWKPQKSVPKVSSIACTIQWCCLSCSRG